MHHAKATAVAFESRSRSSPGRMDPRRRRFVIIALVTIVLFVLYISVGHPPSVSSAVQAGLDYFLHVPDLPAANSTLGFGAIVAVSTLTSKRRNSLLLAANITEIDITIPDQPVWTDTDLKNFVAKNVSTITRGSALAWMGHLNVLRWFLDSGLETMLVMEDDVDWDIHLRTSQVPKVAAAMRTLLTEQANHLPAIPSTRQKIVTPEQAGGYWGNHLDWDILYLGHCGDMFTRSEWTNETEVPRVALSDPTLPSPEYMHILTRRFLAEIGVPIKTRVVHKSISPLCTFGFALSRAGAERLLYDVAASEPEGGCEAYDVRILETCRDLSFRCWSANPELFHHQDAPSEIAIVNAKKGKDHTAKEHDLKASPPGIGVDSEGRLQGAAPNIACGVRGSSFWTQDPDTVEYLKEVVGRQGHCLRDLHAEDMSVWPHL
ncbi:glycosyltransferase family 25 protein, partial [Aureobasidium melanogenum]